MAFTRITRPERDFSIISNLICRNKAISLKALGVYLKIMSFPDTWSFTVAGLIDVVPDGKHAVYQALKELQEHGYCTVETVREGGRIAGTIYHFYDSPQNFQDANFQDIENHDAKNLNSKKQPQLSKKKSSTNKSSTLSNKVSNNEESEIKNFAHAQGIISFDDNGNQITNDSNEKTKRKQTGRAVFVPPSVGEVYDEAIEKGLTREEARFESSQFVNYYESIGWVLGKKKIVSWKAAFAGWLNRSAKWKRKAATTNETSRRDDYADVANMSINSLIK